jgi:hypothetical protein
MPGTAPQFGTRAFLEEMEARYEDSGLVRDVAHSHGYACSNRNTGKTTDSRREAARSGEAEGARWLQARRNGQGNEALGGRMYGTGVKNRYASRRGESGVGPGRGGRSHSEGSAVTLQLYAISTASPQTKKPSAPCSASSTATSATCRRCRACFRVVQRPVVQNVGAERQMVLMRWGMPPRTGRGPHGLR